MATTDTVEEGLGLSTWEVGRSGFQAECYDRKAQVRLVRNHLYLTFDTTVKCTSLEQEAVMFGKGSLLKPLEQLLHSPMPTHSF